MPDRAGAVPRASELAVLWAHVQEPPPTASEHNPELPAEIDPVLGQGDGQGPGRPLRELRRAGRRRTRGARPAPARRDPRPQGAHPHRRRRGDRRGCGARRRPAQPGRRPRQAEHEADASPPRSTRCSGSTRRRTSSSRRSAASARIRMRSRSAPEACGSAAATTDCFRVDPKTNAVRGPVAKTDSPIAIVIRNGSVLVANQFGGATSIDPATLYVGSHSDRATGRSQLAGGAHCGRSAGHVRAPLSTGSTTAARSSRQSQALVSTHSNLRPTEEVSGSSTTAYAPSIASIRPRTGSSGASARLHAGRHRGRRRLGLGHRSGRPHRGRIDPRSNRIDRSIPVGRDPVGVTVGDGSVGRDYKDGTVSRIDPRTGTVVPMGVGHYPATLATGAEGVWVAARADRERRGELVPAAEEMLRLSRPGVPARDPARASGERAAVPQLALADDGVPGWSL